MASHPYTTVPGRIAEFMEKIRSVGIPERVTRNWLQLIGFKSSNDRTLINVLKYIGFTNERANPTDLWRRYRGSDHALVLADAMRDSYQGIFQTFEAPCRLTTNELKDYFRVETGSAEGTVAKMVDTFKALCQIADFKIAKTKPQQAVTAPESSYVESSSGKRPVSIHIELELPVTDDEEVYARIFRAIKKHLLND